MNLKGKKFIKENQQRFLTRLDQAEEEGLLKEFTEEFLMRVRKEIAKRKSQLDKIEIIEEKIPKADKLWFLRKGVLVVMLYLENREKAQEKYFGRRSDRRTCGRD